MSSFLVAWVLAAILGIIVLSSGIIQVQINTSKLGNVWSSSTTPTASYTGKTCTRKDGSTGRDGFQNGVAGCFPGAN